MENTKNGLECFICLDNAKKPVVTQCGHIFCYDCLHNWLRGRSEYTCPVCKNGVDLTKVIPLYTNSNEDSGPDNRPKPERISPVRNIDNRSIVIILSLIIV
jgi:E3 ubiquitin-protein ligase RNF5